MAFPAPRASPAAGLTRLPLLYWSTVLVIWGALIVAYAAGAVVSSVSALLVLVFTVGATAVLWLNGLRHLGLWLVGHFLARHPAPMTRARPTGEAFQARQIARAASSSARVALLYCTADDFSPGALLASMGQRRPVSTVILDDSVSEAGRRAIDAFALEVGARVLRRPEQVGFKAGNLNYGIAALIDSYDYFVILDSDTVLPNDFVSRGLESFSGDDRIGVVQGRNTAAAGRAFFPTMFAGLLGTHIRTTQHARSHAGFSAFMGRGAIISADCLRVSGPIPEAVSEDLAFSLEARRAGFEIEYRPDLVCAEDYPIDYRAFRTQHRKTVEGSVEFLSGSWSRVLRSPLGASERLDLVVDQLLVPLVALAGLALIVMNGVFVVVGGSISQPLWVAAVTALLASAPLLPETLRLARHRGLLVALRFLLLASALYASTLVITLRSTVRVLAGGKAVFRITPKRAQRFSAGEVLRMVRPDLVVGTLAVIAAVLLTGSISAALPIAGSAIAAVGFAFFGTGTRSRGRDDAAPPRHAAQHELGAAGTQFATELG